MTRRRRQSSGATQLQRVARALRQRPQGISQMDFDPGRTIDDKKPIRRVSARIYDLRADHGWRIDGDDRDHDMAVYRLLATPAECPRCEPGECPVEPRKITPLDPPEPTPAAAPPIAVPAGPSEQLPSAPATAPQSAIFGWDDE